MKSGFSIILASIILSVGIPASFHYSKIYLPQKKIQETQINQVKLMLDTLKSELDEKKIKSNFSEFTKQIISGVQEGFRQSSLKTDVKNEEFKEARKLVNVKVIRKGVSSWRTKEKYLLTITNNSEKSVKSIRIVSTYFNQASEIIDVNEKWMSSIKMMEPKESINFAVERSIGAHNNSDEDLEKNKSKSVEVKVLSFDLI